MNVVWAYFRFYYLYAFPVAQLPQYLSYRCFLLLEKYLSSILWCKYYVVFAIPFRMR